MSKTQNPTASEPSTAQAPGPIAIASPSAATLATLCALARFHQIACDPATLAHQLVIASTDTVTTSDLLRGAQHLGLKAKLSRSSVDRLGLVPLPALAVMHTDDGSLRVVILAQSDGKRALFQDVSKSAVPGASTGPTIESAEVFATQWTGELILITSRASLTGALAKFDFTWFIPSLIKYRKLLGEVLLISFMLQIFGLVSPLFFQVVMDKVLVHKGMTTLDVLAIGLLIVVVFESVLNALRAYVFSHTTSRIDVELGARLFRHLIQLPLSYFQARRVGDSIARVRELENIRSFLTGNAMTVLLDVFFSVVFIAVMLFYSVPLTLIVLISLEASVVKAVLVKDGDKVQAGQVLVELDHTMASADQSSLQEQLKAAHSEEQRTQALLQLLSKENQLAQLIRGLEGDLSTKGQLQAQLQAEWQDISAKLSKLDAESNRRQAEIATVKASIAKLEATVPWPKAGKRTSPSW